MGAEQSTAGAPEVAASAPADSQPAVMSLDQAGPEHVLAEMEGVLDGVPGEKIVQGNMTMAEMVALKKVPSPLGTGRSVTTTSSASGFLSTARKMGRTARRALLSWRPEGEAGEDDAMFSSKRGVKHNDPKQVFEGLRGPSLYAALNAPNQLKAILQVQGLYTAPHKTGYTNGGPNSRDADGDRYPLHWAAARGHLRCMHLLLDAGADKSLTDVAGQTAADVALAGGQSLAHSLLVFGQPKPDRKAIHQGLYGASLHSALNQPSQLKRLLKKGKEVRLSEKNMPVEMALNLDLKDTDGDRCALHWAAARGALKCIELLLHFGASCGVTDKDGYTAAGLALEYNQRAAYDLITEWANASPTQRANMISAGGLSRNLASVSLSEPLAKVVEEPAEAEQQQVVQVM